MSDSKVTDQTAVEPDRKRNRIEAVLWFGFALVLYVMAGEFDYPQPHYQLGPAFWPKVILIGIMVFSAALFVSSLQIKFLEKRRFTEGFEADGVEDAPEKPTAKTLLIFVLPILWVIAMYWIGFPLTAPVFLAVVLWLVGVRPKVILIYTVIFYSTLMLIFYKLVFTPLPQGAGWFYTLNGHIIGLIQ